MPRKRTALSQTTKKAKRLKLIRSQECNESRERRLAAARERYAISLSLETSAERETRRHLDRQRHAQSRSSKTKMAAKTETWLQADSDNIPEVDIPMLLEYSCINNKHSIDEIRAAKTMADFYEGDLDFRIGYVELVRNEQCCTVKGKILATNEKTPQHYIVTAKIDEQVKAIQLATCSGCTLQDDAGCRHTLLFLMWLEKKSNLKLDFVQSYWVPPLAGMSFKMSDIFPSAKRITTAKKDPELLKNFVEECKRRKLTNPIVRYYEANTSYEGLSTFSDDNAKSEDSEVNVNDFNDSSDSKCGSDKSNDSEYRPNMSDDSEASNHCHPKKNDNEIHEIVKFEHEVVIIKEEIEFEDNPVE